MRFAFILGTGENRIWKTPLTSSKKLETYFRVFLHFLSYMFIKHGLFLILNGKPKKTERPNNLVNGGVSSNI